MIWPNILGLCALSAVFAVAVWDAAFGYTYRRRIDEAIAQTCDAVAVTDDALVAVAGWRLAFGEADRNLSAEITFSTGLLAERWQAKQDIAVLKRALSELLVSRRQWQQAAWHASVRACAAEDGCRLLADEAHALQHERDLLLEDAAARDRRVVRLEKQVLGLGGALKPSRPTLPC